MKASIVHKGTSILTYIAICGPGFAAGKQTKQPQLLARLLYLFEIVFSGEAGCLGNKGRWCKELLLVVFLPHRLNLQPLLGPLFFLTKKDFKKESKSVSKLLYTIIGNPKTWEPKSTKTIFFTTRKPSRLSGVVALGCRLLLPDAAGGASNGLRRSETNGAEGADGTP